MKRLFSIFVIFALFVCNYSQVFAEEDLQETAIIENIDETELQKITDEEPVTEETQSSDKKEITGEETLIEETQTNGEKDIIDEEPVTEETQSGDEKDITDEETVTEETQTNDEKETTSAETESTEKPEEVSSDNDGMKIHIEDFKYDAKDYSTSTKDVKVYRYLDKVEFDIVLKDAHENTFLKEVAASGETVHCTLKSTWNPRGTMIVLAEFKGSKGEKILWQQPFTSEFEADTKSLNRSMTFYSHHYMKDSDLYSPNPLVNPSLTCDKVTFTGKADEGEFWFISMSMVCSDGEKISSIEAENIEYEYVCKDTLTFLGKDYTDKITLLKRFEGVKTEKIEKQDPEAWVTELVYTTKYGVKVDRYVAFAAKTQLEIESDDAPDWIKPLGDNVEMTVIAFQITHDGEDYNRPLDCMLRFEGNGETVWFRLGSSFGYLKGGIINGIILEENSYYLGFHSLLSFENFVIVRNTVTYDKVGLYLNYESNERRRLQSIDIDLGEISLTLTAEEIDSILGGDKVYENWL